MSAMICLSAPQVTSTKLSSLPWTCRSDGEARGCSVKIFLIVQTSRLNHSFNPHRSLLIVSRRSHVETRCPSSRLWLQSVQRDSSFAGAVLHGSERLGRSVTLRCVVDQTQRYCAFDLTRTGGATSFVGQSSSGLQSRHSTYIFRHKGGRCETPSVSDPVCERRALLSTGVEHLRLTAEFIAFHAKRCNLLTLRER